MLKFTAIPLTLTLLTVSIALSAGLSDGKLDIRKPQLDVKGRFWVYKDGKTLKVENIKPVPHFGIPYAPYVRIPAQAVDMLEMDMEYRQQPFEGDMCIAVRVGEWVNPYWLAVEFVSGPNETMEGGPRWGKKEEYGWCYDLSYLRKKKFVFHLRGEKGIERVQWRVGFLAGEKHGDSLEYSKQGKWLTLKKKWTRYEIDLSENNMEGGSWWGKMDIMGSPKSDLSRVCSFCFVLSRAQQVNSDSPIVFYIDSVYFE